jgi:NAD(P)-dependent dehydrogenase (short-subunit alcohol dehydrogenase family)
MAINVKSVLYGMKYAIPAMVSRGGGSIINWTSVGAVRPYRGTAAYSTSKAAVMTLTKVAALECAKDRIRVNAVSPGYIFPTGMSTMGGATAPAEGQLAIIPMDREGHPDEVASVVAFLASDDASYMTGTCVEIDGGKMAGWK